MKLAHLQDCVVLQAYEVMRLYSFLEETQIFKIECIFEDISDHNLIDAVWTSLGMDTEVDGEDETRRDYYHDEYRKNVSPDMEYEEYSDLVYGLYEDWVKYKKYLKSVDSRIANHE